jgi:hypothetical protein
VCAVRPWQATLAAYPSSPHTHALKETGMPTVADRHAATPATQTRAPRRRHARTECDAHAAQALQRALDRRDNGGATGH